MVKRLTRDVSKIESAQISFFTISTLYFFSPSTSANFHPGFGFGSSFTPSIQPSNQSSALLGTFNMAVNVNPHIPHTHE